MNKLINKIKENNKGFTLVELIVVIAVLAIITVVAAPQYLRYVEKSRIGTDENALGEIAHIAEVEWVELKANADAADIASLDNDILVTIGDDGCFTCATDADLDKLVADMMGKYEVKSNTYANGIGSGITITINTTTGVSDWEDNKLPADYE